MTAPATPASPRPTLISTTPGRNQSFTDARSMTASDIAATAAIVNIGYSRRRDICVAFLLSDTPTVAETIHDTQATCALPVGARHHVISDRIEPSPTGRGCGSGSIGCRSAALSRRTASRPLPPGEAAGEGQSPAPRHRHVIPDRRSGIRTRPIRPWIPAFAGMTPRKYLSALHSRAPFVYPIDTADPCALAPVSPRCGVPDEARPHCHSEPLRRIPYV